MSLKSLLHDLTPPLLWSAVRSLMPSGEFASWDAASRAAGSYSDETINRFRAARAAMNRSAGHRIALEGSALFWLTTTLPEIETIVDFGGATGEFGEELIDARRHLKYIVVENPTLVSLMAGSGRVQFTTSIPPSCDVFFTSGTLQYLPSPYDALESGFRSAKMAAVLARNSFSERQIFRVQKSILFHNGEGAIPEGFENSTITYPHRTISEARVRQIAAQNGFTLLARTPEWDGVVPSKEEVYGQQLVFVRG